MGTLNGIGTRFMGYSAPENDGSVFVTMWFTFVYLPIIPLGRNKILRNPNTKSNQFQYTILKREKLLAKEVLSTYLWSLVVLPLWILGPGFLLNAFGLLDSKDESVMIPSILFYVIWFGFWLWKIKDWDEERGFPKEKQKCFLFKWLKN